MDNHSIEESVQHWLGADQESAVASWKPGAATECIAPAARLAVVVGESRSPVGGFVIHIWMLRVQGVHVADQ